MKYKVQYPAAWSYVLILSLSFGLCLYLYSCFRAQYRVETAVEAEASKVTFLKLPPSASHISYWRDGTNFEAEFTIPEDDFRNLFQRFELRQIKAPKDVFPPTFGDPKTPPFRSRYTARPVSVLAGLEYEVIWDNGGGFDITYDRARSRAYFRHSRR